ncbi:hypothetical protein BKA65DRAFT_500299 [Rhexocercosporidium sp. MPI-PUGE-AT-0058]|nr:hypothetical protein BKA65DRAFT_500299 [Rhexocercosporidium sp. MPI-PUGE-AT-0058]
MSNIGDEPHRGRDLERDRRYCNGHVKYNEAHFDEGHYDYRHYDRPLVASDRPDGTTMFRHQQSNERARSHSIRRSESKSPNLRNSHSISPERAKHLEVPTTRKRGKNDRAAEKAIGAAATAAFRVRNDPGHWIGEKGLKVAGVAAAAATIDTLLDTNPHKHSLQHIAVGMIQGLVLDQITGI